MLISNLAVSDSNNSVDMLTGLMKIKGKEEKHMKLINPYGRDMSGLDSESNYNVTRDGCACSIVGGVSGNTLVKTDDPGCYCYCYYGEENRVANFLLGFN